jgi:hypothetical protein
MLMIVKNVQYGPTPYRFLQSTTIRLQIYEIALLC